LKVFISVDMEGATGITSPSMLYPEGHDFSRGRKLLTGDVNAAVQGAFDGGATEVVVNEAHGNMTNLLLEELDPRAHLISGCTKPLLQMGGIDSSFDAAFLVAYHAMEGSNGLLNHSFMSKSVFRLLLNGEPVGESGTNAAIAAHFGVPVVLVTGDNRVTDEGRIRLGDIETVCVKTTMDRQVARCLAPSVTWPAIRQAAAKAVRRAAQIKPLVVKPPITFRVEFKSSGDMTLPCLLPQVKVIGVRTVELTAEDMPTAFNLLWAMLLLARLSASGVL